jgi:hypothetical protein
MPSGETERQEAAEQEAAEQGKAAAEGKAEEGRLSVKGPGLDVAITVPDAMRGQARANIESAILPPDAEGRGIHVENGGQRGAGRDSVEIRFSVPRPPADVAAWYRDPARRQQFTIAQMARDGNALVLTGTSRQGGPITVRLAPAAGGTDGRLLLVERE